MPPPDGSSLSPTPTPIAWRSTPKVSKAPVCRPVPCYHADQFDRMLDETRPDCLIVTTPDYTHAGYICRALDRDIDVISEKPLTSDEAGLRAICKSMECSRARLTVAFNYRYAPRNTAVKRLIAEGAIGEITSVHFEWLLDTAHGADYFRRWHREKDKSGGLLVHKSTHHFDLVNWWLDDCPASVYALGGLRFYGGRNAAARGVPPSPTLSRNADPRKDPFRLDMAGRSAAASPLSRGRASRRLLSGPERVRRRASPSRTPCR